jgi:Abnormal spindle-like microcephaly-assoc'd, ASPM-SPD-2-Hydin
MKRITLVGLLFLLVGFMPFLAAPPVQAQTIDITPTAIVFGPVFVEESLVRTIEVSNTSDVYTATVTADIFPASSTFTVSGCDTTLITQTACTLSVTFTPPQLDVYTADLTVTAFFAGADITDTATITMTGQGVYEATPSALEGTYGTEITYGGAPGGFGDKKGKIYIAGNKQKIDSWGNLQINMIFTKFKDMAIDTPYDVSIEWKPKGSKTTNIVALPNAFTLRKPSLDALSYHGSPDTEVTITGMWFGTKKGKVIVNDKKCKITNWSMNPTTGVSTLTFVVHKKLLAGTWFIDVENKIGIVRAAFIVD